jgi:hypothetical protein
MEQLIVVLCRENDCAIKIHLFDDDCENKIDEFEFGDPDVPEYGWIVIGFDDMKQAFKMAGYEIIKAK